jgi:uncharacterized membrane protein
MYTLSVSAQVTTATLQGTVKDKKDGSDLIGVSVIIKGTSLGAASDENGKFIIRNIKPGTYDVEVSYIGYAKVLLTEIKLKAGEVKELQLELIPTSFTMEDVVIIGKKPVIDIEKSASVSACGVLAETRSAWLAAALMRPPCRAAVQPRQDR